MSFLAKEVTHTFITHASHQVSLFRIRPQDDRSSKQPFKDLADGILTGLLVIQERTGHPIHLGIMLNEQPFYFFLFHLYFTTYTRQKDEKLTSHG